MDAEIEFLNMVTIVQIPKNTRYISNFTHLDACKKRI